MQNSADNHADHHGTHPVMGKCHSSIRTADNTDELSREKLGSKVAESDIRIITEGGWMGTGTTRVEKEWG